MNRHGGPRIPLAPLTEWCREQIALEVARSTNTAVPYTGSTYGPSATVADRLGIHVRALNRLTRGVYAGCRDGVKGEFPIETVGRHYVEDILTRAGVDFYELYPEFLHERDIDLEPDQWCRCCREYVTPIDSICPWCDYHMEDQLRMWAA